MSEHKLVATIKKYLEPVKQGTQIAEYHRLIETIAVDKKTGNDVVIDEDPKPLWGMTKEQVIALLNNDIAIENNRHDAAIVFFQKQLDEITAL